jgi:hypothetical protein
MMQIDDVFIPDLGEKQKAKLENLKETSETNLLESLLGPEWSSPADPRIQELEEKLRMAEQRCANLTRYIEQSMDLIPLDNQMDSRIAEDHEGSSTPVSDQQQYMGSSPSSSEQQLCVPAFKKIQAVSQAHNWSFPDEHNLILRKCNLLRALFQNARIFLNVAPTIDTAVLMQEDSISPFCHADSRTLMPLLTDVPENFRPTQLQMSLPHHPYIDLFPWPTFRDKVLSVLNFINEDVFCADIHESDAGEIPPSFLMSKVYMSQEHASHHDGILHRHQLFFSHILFIFI